MWYSYVCEIYLYSSVDDGDQLQDHIRLDHRQFETAHLRYAVLMTQARYPTVNTIHHPIAMTTDVSDTLQKFTPIFYEAFSTRSSGKDVNKSL